LANAVARLYNTVKRGDDKAKLRVRRLRLKIGTVDAVRRDLTHP
jgi:hypothetical protein